MMSPYIDKAPTKGSTVRRAKFVFDAEFRPSQTLGSKYVGVNCGKTIHLHRSSR
jgi:hypothetical protein